MPNHVTNILTIEGPTKRVKEIFAAISPVDPTLASKPLPARKAGVVFAAASEEEVARRKVDIHEIDFDKIIPAPKTKAYRNQGWYNWNIEHWDTKWNAYSQEKVDDHTMRFDTAWGAPYAIFRALSEKFPDVTIKVRYADEDFGQNCGELEYRGGSETYNAGIEEGSKEAYELAFDVKGYGADEYVYDEKKGTYVYRDNAEDNEPVHNESVKNVGRMTADLKSIFEADHVFKAASAEDVAKRREDLDRKTGEVSKSFYDAEYKRNVDVLLYKRRSDWSDSDAPKWTVEFDNGYHGGYYVSTIFGKDERIGHYRRVGCRGVGLVLHGGDENRSAIGAQCMDTIMDWIAATIHARGEKIEEAGVMPNAGDENLISHETLSGTDYKHQSVNKPVFKAANQEELARRGIKQPKFQNGQRVVYHTSIRGIDDYLDGRIGTIAMYRPVEDSTGGVLYRYEVKFVHPFIFFRWTTEDYLTPVTNEAAEEVFKAASPEDVAKRPESKIQVGDTAMYMGGNPSSKYYRRFCKVTDMRTNTYGTNWVVHDVRADIKFQDGKGLRNVDVDHLEKIFQ